jgi:membrane-associated phospholipid phosphatase
MIWIRRSVVGLLLLLGLLALLRFDVPLMGWRFQWGPGQPRGLLRQVLFGFRDFAQIVPLVAMALVVAAYDIRRKQVLLVLISTQVVVMGLVNVTKHLVVRQRPRAADFPPAAAVAPPSWLTWQGLKILNRDEKTQSFPSGHSAHAFAVAAVLAWFYPRLRWMFWSLAVGCAVSRYVDGVHWPSDCLAGAIIGYIIAWAILRVTGCRSAGLSSPQAASG